jgi:predicted ATPase
LEGSTRLWEEHPEGMRDALTRHDTFVRGAVESHGGHVVKGGGDGGLAVFGAVGDALRAAVALQLAMKSEAWERTGPLKVRMGIHTGEAQCRDNDYFGPVLNRTARLMAVAHGGQIVCSQATADVARDASIGDLKLIDLGEHRLRDLSRPERVYQVDAPGLDSDFAALRSMDSYPGNLPLQVSSFVGRGKELELTAAALGEARVVTLTGVGGVGKTRLALQVAAEALPRFREGAWLVELAAVRDPDAVVDAFAAVFGVTPRSGLTLAQSLVEFLGSKQLLLVVDNCEHLLDPVAVLVEDITRSCLGVVILSTSREGLAISGERILAVPSLGTPAQDAGMDVVADSEAVHLFLDRARAADATFALSQSNVDAVVRLCRRLDGVPLALELAAARVSVMTPAELVAALDHRFEVLSGGRRGAVKRQQTLRATIDWSYDLLSAAQQRLLARLAVFAGGCTRNAAEAVCVGDPIEERSVFGLLTQLVERCLVVAERDRPGTRYRLLETIREYAEERLAEHGETEDLRRRHAEYYTEFARVFSERVLGPDQVEVGELIAAERDNILAATIFAVDTDNVDLALRLAREMRTSWLGLNYRLRLDELPLMNLTGVTEHPLYAYGLLLAASYAAFTADLETAAERADQAMAEAARLEDTDRFEVESYAFSIHGTLMSARGATHAAAQYLERAAAASRSAGRPPETAYNLASAATYYAMSGGSEAALPLATEAQVIARSIQMPSLTVFTNVALAGALVVDDPKRARELLHEGMELMGATVGFETWTEVVQAVLISARLGDWPQTMTLAGPAIRHLQWTSDRPLIGAILNLVAHCLSGRDPEASAVLQGAARALAAGLPTAPAEVVGPSTAPNETPSSPGGSDFVTLLRRTTTGMLRESLGEARLRELRHEGEVLDRDQAVAYALEVIARDQQAALTT